MKIDKEILVGLLLTILLGIVLTFVHNRSVHHHAINSFILNATFTKADGLPQNGEVRLAGINVGRIGEQTLSPNGHQVVVQLIFDKHLDIPMDSSVSIETDGIMGAKHVEILPGGDEEMMKNGDMFSYTQDALIMNELLEKVNAYMRDKKESQTQDEGEMP